MLLDRLHPDGPSTAHLRVGPASIGFQHARQTQHPGCELHVHEGDLRAEKERSSRIGNVDEMRDLRLQLLGVLQLLVERLGLQTLIEERDDLAIDLRQVP